MKRVIKVLQDAREQAVMLEKMYREDVIPKAKDAFNSAVSQLVNEQEKIVEIDQLLKLANE